MKKRVIIVDFETLLNNYVEKLKEYYHIGKYPLDRVERVCNECDIENFRFAIHHNLEYEQLDFKKLGLKEPFHKASILGKDYLTEIKWYIIDPTYGQFFEEESFKNYMLENHKEFSLELLDKGYIECNTNSILAYISGFLYSGAFNNMNDIEILRNLKNLLDNQEILEYSSEFFLKRK